MISKDNEKKARGRKAVPIQDKQLLPIFPLNI